MPQPWTDDRIRLLERLWTEGLSASEIAERFGDLTRNAVLGKLHRLGRLGRGRPTRSARPAGPTRPKRQSSHTAAVRARVIAPPSPLPPEVLLTPPAPLVSLRPGQCRWPVGDPHAEGFGFCGAPIRRGAYCLGHAARAYLPVATPGRQRTQRSALATGS